MPDISTQPARLYVIPAAQAPVAVVFRRGPSQWWHIMRWDLETMALLPGAWFKGNLYPRRANLSPDGRLLGYFALKGSSPAPWNTYFAVSKLPWLTALAAWETTGTWTTGCYFAQGGRLLISGAGGTPFHGRYPWPVNDQPWPWPTQHAHAYQNGWIEQQAGEQEQLLPLYKSRLPDSQGSSPETPLILEKARPQPGPLKGRRTKKKKPAALVQLHWPVSWNHKIEYRVEYVDGRYFCHTGDGKLQHLPRAYWADWDGQGRLLMATREGTLEIYEVEDHALKLHWFEDLTPLAPTPVKSPDWARHW